MIPRAPAVPVPKRERRRLVVVGGVLVAIVSAIVVYVVSQRSAERVDVVGIAADVAWGEQITTSDLRRVQVVLDPGLTPVAWSSATLLVGKFAAVDLRAGTLLTADSVTTARVPEEGMALVGLSVKIGQMPSSTLTAGDRVQLVTLPTQSSSEKVPDPVEATVYRMGGVVSGGQYPVDVIVAQKDSARIAADAAANRIVIVLYPRR